MEAQKQKPYYPHDALNYINNSWVKKKTKNEVVYCPSGHKCNLTRQSDSVF